MGNIGPSSSPLMKLHLGSVYFILSTFFLHHMQYRVVIHMHSLHCILTKVDNSGMDLILWVTPCRRNMVGSLPRGMPKVVDYRQTGAQATNEMMTQDKHEFYPGSATVRA